MPELVANAVDFETSCCHKIVEFFDVRAYFCCLINCSLGLLKNVSWSFLCNFSLDKFLSDPFDFLSSKTG